MTVEHKPWGWTEVEVSHPGCTAHRIDIRPWSCCSWHVHRRKWNGFHVRTGVLTIELLIEGKTEVEKVVLQPGDTYAVAPDVVHRFATHSAKHVSAMEWYWLDSPFSAGYDVRDPDIERFSEGGRL